MGAADWIGSGPCIAVNLASTGTHFDVAVRDVEMALAAYALARITAEREALLRTSGRTVSVTGHAVA